MLIFFIAGGQPCAAGADNTTLRIQDILIQWTNIEHRLTVENIDVFHSSIRSYLDSEMYRIYRLAPLSHRTYSGLPIPNELPEILAAADLVLSLREAVSNGRHEEVRRLSTDISGNLVKAMIRDTQADKFAGTAVSRLFLALIFFVLLSVIIIFSLNRALANSLLREEESTVYSRAVILAQEDERSRLSRELHDTIAQELRYLSLEINKISETEDKGEKNKLCAETAAKQSDLIRKVRDICDYLVPPDFRFQGLPDALHRLCNDYRIRTGIDCRFNIAENINIGFLNDEMQLQIFRIVQEALNNADKHAKATEVIVLLRNDPNGDLFVGVSDDGIGFSPKKPYTAPSASQAQYSGNNHHLGIRGMKERAELIGGKLEIKSEDGEGTLVYLKMPVRSQKNKGA